MMGRHILDNNFLAQESFEWAVESEHDLVLLLFDLEKTFDRIKWGFFFLALSKLGFSPKQIKWVSWLYWLASSSVKVNEKSGKDFKLSRAAKQGYLLAPYYLYWQRMSLDICWMILNIMWRGWPYPKEVESKTKPLLMIPISISRKPKQHGHKAVSVGSLLFRIQGENQLGEICHHLG